MRSGSANGLFLTGSSQVGSHLPRNYWPKETGQVRVAQAAAPIFVIEKGTFRRTENVIFFNKNNGLSCSPV